MGVCSSSPVPPSSSSSKSSSFPVKPSSPVLKSVKVKEKEKLKENEKERRSTASLSSKSRSSRLFLTSKSSRSSLNTHTNANINTITSGSTSHISNTSIPPLSVPPFASSACSSPRLGGSRPLPSPQRTLGQTINPRSSPLLFSHLLTANNSATLNISSSVCSSPRSSVPPFLPPASSFSPHHLNPTNSPHHANNKENNENSDENPLCTPRSIVYEGPTSTPRSGIDCTVIYSTPPCALNSPSSCSAPHRFTLSSPVSLPLPSPTQRTIQLPSSFSSSTSHTVIQFDPTEQQWHWFTQHRKAGAAGAGTGNRGLLVDSPRHYSNNVKFVMNQQKYMMNGTIENNNGRDSNQCYSPMNSYNHEMSSSNSISNIEHFLPSSFSGGSGSSGMSSIPSMSSNMSVSSVYSRLPKPSSRTFVSSTNNSLSTDSFLASSTVLHSTESSVNLSANHMNSHSDSELSPPLFCTKLSPTNKGKRRDEERKENRRGGEEKEMILLPKEFNGGSVTYTYANAKASSSSSSSCSSSSSDPSLSPLSPSPVIPLLMNPPSPTLSLPGTVRVHE